MISFYQAREKRRSWQSKREHLCGICFLTLYSVIDKKDAVRLFSHEKKTSTIAAPLQCTSDKGNRASCTPASPSSWLLETVINREVQIHMAANTRNTATPLHKIKWIRHCRSFSTVLHTLTDPITGQRSQDSPILPQYTIGPPPTRFSPSSQHFPHSFIHPPLFTPFLLSCHLSLRLPLNGYWLCSHSIRSLSVSIANVSANHRLNALCTFTSLFLATLYVRQNAKWCFSNLFWTIY